MKLRLADKSKHLRYGKKHTADAKKAISKPGNLNPMFNKKHRIDSKQKNFSCSK